MAFSVFVLVVIVSVSSIQAANPWFCQKYDCPAFTAKDKGGYELRTYEASNWVATSTTTRRPDPSSKETSSMFRKLFGYISGDNVNGQDIKMTVPVLTKVEKLSSGYKVTMMFYLTLASPPSPTKEGVFLVKKPAGNVFVRMFPGWWWPSKKTYRDEVDVMKKVLDDPTLYVANTYYKAGYNSPYAYFKRKQFEVWMDAQ